MYAWRQLTTDERDSLLENRKLSGLPWHRPPQVRSDTTNDYLLTAACYEHESIIGQSSARLGSFESALLVTLAEISTQIFAWSILPNHYHAVIQAPILPQLSRAIGQLHGRTSYQWNKEDSTPGRKVWFGSSTRYMRSERHFFTTLNYVHHNAVKHNVVEKWEDWPFSSAQQFLQSVDREEAIRLWREYPIRNYGDQWDTFPLVSARLKAELRTSSAEA